MSLRDRKPSCASGPGVWDHLFSKFKLMFLQREVGFFLGMLTGISSWHPYVRADVHNTLACSCQGHIPTAHLPVAVVSGGPSQCHYHVNFLPRDGAECVNGEEVSREGSLSRCLLIFEIDFKAFSF